MLRPLPPRPGAPEERLKKLELGRGRSSGPRPKGPLRADHAVPLPGSPPPAVALPLPSRTNLARSKSVSSGDLRPVGLALGGHRGAAGELGAALSRLALRPEPPALRRSTSLRRLGGFPGPPALLSIRAEPPPSHGAFHMISARPEAFYPSDKMVRARAMHVASSMFLCPLYPGSAPTALLQHARHFPTPQGLCAAI